MNYFFFALRAIFYFLSLVLFIGLLTSVFVYVFNNSRTNISPSTISNIAIYMVVSICLTYIFHTISERSGYSR